MHQNFNMIIQNQIILFIVLKFKELAQAKQDKAFSF